VQACIRAAFFIFCYRHSTPLFSRPHVYHAALFFFFSSFPRWLKIFFDFWLSSPILSSFRHQPFLLAFFHFRYAAVVRQTASGLPRWRRPTCRRHFTLRQRAPLPSPPPFHQPPIYCFSRHLPLSYFIDYADPSSPPAPADAMRHSMIADDISADSSLAFFLRLLSPFRRQLIVFDIVFFFFFFLRLTVFSMVSHFLSITDSFHFIIFSSFLHFLHCIFLLLSLPFFFSCFDYASLSFSLHFSH